MSALTRKIVHIDMDAFYASVEQRDDPALRARPVVVAWRGPRSVVCAASYEARRYGVRSAMAVARAERICPEAVFVAPDFSRYRAVSRQIHAIFRRHTDLVEPLSLDEAYLDVTVNKLGFPSATRLAECVRAEIREQTGLTASAGVAPNKFLAKIASDWNKPDGQFVIRPAEITEFLASLAVARLPGVGKVTATRLGGLGVQTVGQLRGLETARLVQQFGRYGHRLYELARGIDHSEVRPDRPVQSVSSEDTFERDLELSALAPHIRRMAEKTWSATARTERVPQTVILKLKTAAFQVITRSFTPSSAPASAAELTEIALALLRRVDHDAAVRYRLVGVGLGNFRDRDDDVWQGDLFALSDAGRGSGPDV